MCSAAVFRLPGEGRHIRLNVSSTGLKIIDRTASRPSSPGCAPGGELLMVRSTDVRPVIKLRSTGGTGFTYVTRRNRRNDPDTAVAQVHRPQPNPPAGGGLGPGQPVAVDGEGVEGGVVAGRQPTQFAQRAVAVAVQQPVEPAVRAGCGPDDRAAVKEQRREERGAVPQHARGPSAVPTARRPRRPSTPAAERGRRGAGDKVTSAASAAARVAADALCFIDIQP
jgi:large subunit ribosomal protein L33